MRIPASTLTAAKPWHARVPWATGRKGYRRTLGRSLATPSSQLNSTQQPNRFKRHRVFKAWLPSPRTFLPPTSYDVRITGNQTHAPPGAWSRLMRAEPRQRSQLGKGPGTSLCEGRKAISCRQAELLRGLRPPRELKRPCASLMS